MSSSIKLPSSGVYLTPVKLDAVRAQAEKANLAWFELNLAQVENKQQFLSTCAKRLRFPATFGRNWDALADCLKDLCADSVVRLRNCAAFAEAAPDDYATALEIFRDAAMYWQERGSVFLALADTEPEGGWLPQWPGPTRAA